MIPFRLVLSCVLAGCLLHPGSVSAQSATTNATAAPSAPAKAPVYVAPPFEMNTAQYSADVAIALKSGMKFNSKVYANGDKMRSDFSMGGMDMSTIVRKDKLKIYQIMTSQKMAMEMDFDPSKMKGNVAAAFGPEGKFELIGPETIDGIATTKYKVTSDKNGSSAFFWLDVPHKAPVQFTSADGSVTAKWSNFKPGPQPPELFEVPSNFNIMAMPSGMGMPGSAPSAAPDGAPTMGQ